MVWISLCDRRTDQNLWMDFYGTAVMVRLILWVVCVLVWCWCSVVWLNAWGLNKLSFPQTRPTLIFKPPTLKFYGLLGPKSFGFNFHHGLVCWQTIWKKKKHWRQEIDFCGWRWLPLVVYFLLTSMESVCFRYWILWIRFLMSSRSSQLTFVSIVLLVLRTEVNGCCLQQTVSLCERPKQMWTGFWFRVAT